MQEKLVSVIVPAYNGEKHLAATLESIINQDYENLEIIFVNDASTDNTLNIAENVLKNSGRVYKIINHEKNSGVSVSRNDGLDAARGEYVWFCDGDDLADKSFVSSLYREIEDKNADLVFSPFKNYFKNENRYEISDFANVKENFSNGKYFLKLWIAKKILFRGVWNCIFKKDFLIEKNLHFKKSCIFGEDEEFLIKAMIFASKAVFYRQTFYVYVLHDNQAIFQHRDTNIKLKAHKHLMLANFRVSMVSRKQSNDKQLRQYATNFLIPDSIVKLMTIYAQLGNIEIYTKMLKTLQHKKIRQVMLSTWHFIFEKPELFFKSLMIIYAPNLYYKLRKKSHEIKY